MIKFLTFLILAYPMYIASQEVRWRGIKIAKEERCSPYDREKDYLEGKLQRQGGQGPSFQWTFPQEQKNGYSLRIPIPYIIRMIKLF